MYTDTLIIYGSSLGNTRFVAEKLNELLPGSTLADVRDIRPEQIAGFGKLVLGTSTWGVGLLQDEFEHFMNTLSGLDLKGKTIAIFGLGDQQNYPDSFCDAMGMIYEMLQGKGVNFIGEWEPDDYDFSMSKALINGKLVGLALDEDNEPDLTDYRLKKWIKKIGDTLAD